VKQNLNWLYKNKTLQHILFWVIHVVFYGTLYGSFEDNYGQTYLEELMFLPVRVLFTYFTLYVLLPGFLLPGRYAAFLGLFLLGSLVAGIMQRYVGFSLNYPMYHPEFLRDPFFYFPKIVKTFVGIYPVVFLALVIKLFKHWYATQQEQQILKEEKLSAELKFLKTQIHPHFLFNTLNNLYALTLKKSERAPEMVLKLSELINYMLYECKSEEVDLSREIKFIQNYVDIEKMRYGDKLDVDLRVSGTVTDRKIAPLILLPFVENCFKHGASENLQQSWVKISVDSYADHLVIKVENSKSGEKAGNGAAGIGIQNVRRRLDLLYGEKYQLKIINGEETYLVVLSINQ
jgi:two-component system, LytTR family, sensor kinase